ncbi:MAG: glycosyltransferase family 1 protein [bacterium]
MKICIDARWIFPELSGIGLYTQELMRSLAEIDRANEYLVLFGDKAVAERTLAKVRAGVECRVSSVALFSPKNQIWLRGLLRRECIDLYHSTNYMMPLFGMGRIKRIVTIHDLIPLLFRDHAPQAKKAKLFPIYKRLMHEVGARADLILTVSESTKRDIVRELKVTADKITVTPEGVGPEYHPPNTRHPTLDTPHILYVGRRDPYKNLPLLIEAFAVMAKKVPAARLRIIGPADDRYPEAPALAKTLGLNDRIDWIGYVTPGQLIEEYRGASVFALPSRYEGFGLTVLEAMACGAPVVCSNVSSLPEVAGDAALLVPPGDRTALADALVRVLTDRNLAATLRKKGLAQSARFTWRQTAELTLRAYEQVGAR